jgi:hypothetical protein
MSGLADRKFESHAYFQEAARFSAHWIVSRVGSAANSESQLVISIDMDEGGSFKEHHHRARALNTRGSGFGGEFNSDKTHLLMSMRYTSVLLGSGSA